MKKQNFIARILCSLGGDKYTEETMLKSLKDVYELAQGSIRELDIKTDKWILFSDLHRGAKNKADDFWNCEAAYCAALAYYFEMGYNLCVMGDAEELWEERPQLVLSRNDASFSIERKFHENGRYARLWGNHDEIWGVADNVHEQLEPVYGNIPLEVPEAILLKIKNGKKVLGETLLIHGHQGTQNQGDKNEFAKWVLHNIWRPLQQLTGFSCNTPAKDWKLRRDRDKIIYKWVSTHSGLFLIAGHTHAPVFASRSHRLHLIEQLHEARQNLSRLSARQKTKRAEVTEQIAEFAAELEWIEHRISDEEKMELTPLDNPKPCYFNTGCCSFADGDITGIEIADGEIRLVRWPDDNEQPLRKVLQSTSLEKVFQQLQ